MPNITYIPRTFTPSSRDTITRANSIITEYQAQGFDLTLRQLYYQFVARGFIPNRDSEYKKLGSIINDARLAGMIDWNAIEDRTRNLRGVGHWDQPSDIIRGAAYSFRQDKWRDQENRVEVWIEKDALVGVISSVCERLDVNYFSCRGYVSQSEMWQAAQRHIGYLQSGQEVTILHLGDHDPSGLDMSRDIEDRLNLFALTDLDGYSFTSLEDLQTYRDEFKIHVNRIALNMNQVRAYNPPPNPAKLTDARVWKYISRYGNESWELDALDPRVLSDLVENNVLPLRDEDTWAEAVDVERVHRTHLTKAASRWPEVASYVASI